MGCGCLGFWVLGFGFLGIWVSRFWVLGLGFGFKSLLEYFQVFEVLEKYFFILAGHPRVFFSGLVNLFSFAWF